MALARFSALQRAEIAEILAAFHVSCSATSFSALQRAEIAEIVLAGSVPAGSSRFSALQRAEIAEIGRSRARPKSLNMQVSVLFNEPKLLKYRRCGCLA